MYNLVVSFMVISDVYGSFIPNSTTFSKYCFRQWISKLTDSFEIHRVRQYLENFTELADKINAIVYKSETIFTGLEHSKLLTLKYIDILHCSIHKTQVESILFEKYQ